MRKPAWASKLGVNDKTTFSGEAQPGSFFNIIEEKRAGAAVMVKGKIRRGDVDRVILVQLPKATNERLQASVIGANAPAIVGLVEWALDELDRQGKTLALENK